MSDCGVCLYGESDEIACEIDESIQIAETTKHCCECPKAINCGDKYAQAILYMGEDDDGEPCDPQTYVTCLICDEIADAFFCNGRMYGGALWEEFHNSDAFANLNTGCFNKLKTPEAKAELQRRWIEWKFSQGGAA